MITPIAFPTLSRGRDGATRVLPEAGMPPKRSGVRCNSVVGVAVAEGFAGSAGWPPVAASSAACADGAAGAVSAGDDCGDGGGSDGGV